MLSQQNWDDNHLAMNGHATQNPLNAFDYAHSIIVGWFAGYLRGSHGAKDKVKRAKGLQLETSRVP